MTPAETMWLAHHPPDRRPVVCEYADTPRAALAAGRAAALAAGLDPDLVDVERVRLHRSVEDVEDIPADRWVMFGAPYVPDGCLVVSGLLVRSRADGARLAAADDLAALAAEGRDAAIASAAVDGTARGAWGTWICLAEYRDGRCAGFAVGRIGAGGLRPDTWYHAENGRLVESFDPPATEPSP